MPDVALVRHADPRKHRERGDDADERCTQTPSQEWSEHPNDPTRDESSAVVRCDNTGWRDAVGIDGAVPRVMNSTIVYTEYTEAIIKPLTTPVLISVGISTLPRSQISSARVVATEYQPAEPSEHDRASDQRSGVNSGPRSQTPRHKSKTER